MNTTPPISNLAPVGIYQTDNEGNNLYVSKSRCAITDISAKEAHGSWIEAIHPDDRHQVWQMWQQSLSSNTAFDAEYRFQRKDDKEIWGVGRANRQLDQQDRLIGHIGIITDISGHMIYQHALQRDHRRTSTILDNGNITHYVATGRDVTELMATQERLSELAHHAPLTGLSNRMLFMDRLQHALARAQREQLHLALLYLDLDQFKKINDTLDHQIGDALLQQMANRLKDNLRNEEMLDELLNSSRATRH